MKSLQWVNNVTDISLLYESVWRVEMKARALSVTHRATDLRANALKRKYRIKRAVSQIHKFVNLHGRWNLTPQKMKVPTWAQKKSHVTWFLKWVPSLWCRRRRVIKVVHCTWWCQIFTKIMKKVKKWPSLENRPGPYKWLGFAHFLSTFSSVQKEKMTFWPCFWAIFCTAPWPPGNRFFEVFEEKV